MDVLETIKKLTIENIIWVVSFTPVSLKGHYLHHANFLSSITSSFAPASQQRIKRLKPTNTRLKQQFEEFWEPKKHKGGRVSDPKLFESPPLSGATFSEPNDFNLYICVVVFYVHICWGSAARGSSL